MVSSSHKNPSLSRRTTDSIATEGHLSLIRAVERVCDILDLLREAESDLSLSDIVDKTGLPKSTLYRYLVALSERNYVERDEMTNNVRLGPAFRPKPSRRMDQFLELAKSTLEILRERTGETINLGVLDGNQYVHVLVAESENRMRLAARVGDRGMIHSTAIGKVIATQLPLERVREILASEGMPRFTNRTITTPDAFIAELHQVRRRGYAVDDLENQDDGRCLATPIKGCDVPMGLSVSAPARRLPPSKLHACAKALKSAANKLSSEYQRLLD